MNCRWCHFPLTATEEAATTDVCLDCIEESEAMHRQNDPHYISDADLGRVDYDDEDDFPHGWDEDWDSEDGIFDYCVICGAWLFSAAGFGLCEECRNGMTPAPVDRGEMDCGENGKRKR